MTLIPFDKDKGWPVTTYQDELPKELVIRVNRRTIGIRLRKCRYLLKRGGGIFHEPGGKVISRDSLPLIEAMIEDGRLKDGGPATDPPDARIFTYAGSPETQS